MNHLRMYLPEVFPELDRIIFLDDDVVVQKDLTGLWELEMRGKVRAHSRCIKSQVLSAENSISDCSQPSCFFLRKVLQPLCVRRVADRPMGDGYVGEGDECDSGIFDVLETVEC